MVERLAMAADEVNLAAKAALGGEHGVGVKLAEKKIQSGQIGHARLPGVHRLQHGLADVFGIGKFRVSQDLKDRFVDPAARGRVARDHMACTRATLIPSAEVPLMTPATIIAWRMRTFFAEFPELP